MCILALARFKKPSLEMLKKFECANGDGGGIAWFGEKNKAYYKKNLTATEMFKVMENLPLPLMIHFRASSVGGKNTLLTHPFVISKDSPLALEGSAERLLAHNGHDSSYDIYMAAANIEFTKDSPVSDTRAVAAVISNNNEKFLCRARGSYAVMDGKARKIRLYGDFKQEGGIVFSNLSWKWKNQTTTYHYPARTSYEESNFQNEGGSQSHSTTEKSRKEKRKEWWENHIKEREAAEKAAATNITDAVVLHEEGSTNLPARIHEQPPEKHLADNTRKILGLTPIPAVVGIV